MQNGARQKPVSKFLTEPFEVSRIHARGCGGRLHFNRYDAVTGQLRQAVDLVTAPLITQVVKPRGARTRDELGSQLGNHEGV